MDRRLYDQMDWPEIEAVVYSEEDHPRDIMGPRITPDGVLIQAFFPGEKSLWLKTGTTEHEMESVEESGYFAILLNRKTIPAHTFLTKNGGVEKEYPDPYAFPPQITKKEETRFQAGIWYDAWKKMGAHAMKVNGTEGVFFAVYAPNALRVSVVGAFNAWDGRRDQMNRMDSGIFELFIPGLAAGRAYKYEIKLKSGETYLKADPYAGAFEGGVDGASLVWPETEHVWGDEEWLKRRPSVQNERQPMIVCQVSLPKLAEKAGHPEYRVMARTLAEHCQTYGYTHVELTPVTEYPDDASEGFETSGYFAPTSRYGNPDDFRYFVDYLHRMGIGVIIDQVFSYFAAGNSLLAGFDGTCLYEHLDPRRGIHPAFGTHIFNYGSGEVVNFLTSAAMCWAQEYHVDGMKITDVATMLFQDYGRASGSWVANLYGGNENLEAVAFLKKLNTALHALPGFLTIAEDMAGWNGITADPKEDGIGFDYKWNSTWASDFLNYMHYDPLFRGAHHDDLTFDTVFAWSERTLIGFGRDETGGREDGLLRRMAGITAEQKEANERLALSYLFVYPGKKLLDMETDGGNRSGLVKKLTAMCRDLPALHEKDTSPDGFEWISNLDRDRNLLIFLRKGKRKDETLLVVCNFSNIEYDEFLIGVPWPGKYKEIFNSDAEEFGGSGAVNSRVKISQPIEHDERKNSIRVCVQPLGISIYQYTEAVGRRSNNRSAKKRPAGAGGGRNLKREIEEQVEREGG
ncbi:MAG: 1,4-alpha-glucan branching enzyme [Lachnospiraceae bacterium]|jgi:1,4-alpha-glucan branching enzyme|nr:1,4-alpha-glucan branching enzyme [Lachnospiraceae bacterium]MCI1327883.1 1,4-alpha-glucan branching enzyme [Lachnospiraceae bacterium]